jgi:hypothetical protein
MLNQARESARLCSALQFAKHQNEVLSLMPNSIQLMPNSVWPIKKQLNGSRRIESKGENICTQARSACREELADSDRRGRRQNCLSQIHNGDRWWVFLLTVAMEERRVLPARKTAAQHQNSCRTSVTTNGCFPSKATKIPSLSWRRTDRFSG